MLTYLDTYIFLYWIEGPAPVTGTGWTAVIPGWGALVHDQGYTLQPPVAPVSTICRVGPDEIVLPLDGVEVRIPSRPFLGTVGGCAAEGATALALAVEGIPG